MTQNDTNNTFKNLGRSFQEKVMQALLVDRAWAASFVEVFEGQIDDCLEYADLKLVARKYIGHYDKYKEFPSLELLISIIKEELKVSTDAMLRERMIGFLKRVAGNKELGDLGWVKEKAFVFCRQQQVKKALIESAELSENEENYDAMVEKLKKAISAGTAISDGLDYNEEIDARYSETYRRCVPTGISQLDSRQILNGGLGGGEIGIVVAPTGVGKSHMLVHFGSQALLQGKNVLHYTLELNERITGIRYDSHLTGINSTDCFEHKEEIREFFQANMAKLGKLRIKHLPPKTTTANTLRSHMDKLRLRNFSPDLICVDYAGIMRSTSKYELMRLELKEVIQELRDLAEELDIPLWTALQSNKAGSDAEIVDLTNMAESYAQAHVADVVFGLGRKPAEKSTGLGSLFVAKNRAGMDGITYRIHLDTARSTIRILSDEEARDAAEQVQEAIQAAEEDNTKAAARNFQKIMQQNKGIFRRVS